MVQRLPSLLAAREVCGLNQGEIFFALSLSFRFFYKHSSGMLESHPSGLHTNI